LCDIEAAREHLWDSNTARTKTFIHTSNERLRDAVRKRDKIDYNVKLKKIFNSVKTGKLKQQDFNEQIRKLFKF